MKYQGEVESKESLRFTLAQDTLSYTKDHNGVGILEKNADKL